MLSSMRPGREKSLPIDPSKSVSMDHVEEFEEVRDAITSAQIAQLEHPSALIAVADRLTGRLVARLAF